MAKDPNGVKVVAFKVPPKNRNKQGQPVTKDRSDDSPPGNNSPQEVRDAQRNLLACAIAADMVGVISDGDDGYKLDVEKYDPVMDDVLEMITPNTAYVTNPPSMGQIKDTGGLYGFGERKSLAERDAYWQGQRGGHET